MYQQLVDFEPLSAAFQGNKSLVSSVENSVIIIPGKYPNFVAVFYIRLHPKFAFFDPPVRFQIMGRQFVSTVDDSVCDQLDR